MANEMGHGKWIFSGGKIKYIAIIVLFIVVIGALVTVGLLMRDRTVATVNGEKITRNELYAAMYAQVGKDVLDGLITRRLITQEGKRLGLVVSEAEIDEEIDRIIQDNFMGIKEQFEQVLEQYGLSMETVRNDARVNLMARKIARQQMEITDEEMENYFKENQTLFNIPDEVNARHILVDTEEEANEVIELLNQGADFADLARERSKDPGSKDQGGNLGFFKPGEMLPEFDEVAFSLEVGQIGGPVKTGYGFHVIEVLEKKSGREVSFAEVKDQVSEKMVEQGLQGVLQALISRLRAEANIVYR